MVASDFSLDATSSKLNQPIHLQVRQLLRNIITREFADGQKFYSERKLSEKLKISQVTTGRVLHDLVREGHLVSSPRRGFFVRKVAQNSHLGLLCPPPGGKSLPNRTLEGLAEVCSDRDIYIHLYYTQLTDSPDQMIRRIAHKPTEERIIITGFTTQLSLELYAKLRDQGYQTLILGGTPDSFSGKAVSINHKAEVELILDHLTGLGHRRIYFVFNEPGELLTSNRRRELVVEALQKRNLGEARLIDCGTPNGGDSHAAAYTKTREIMATHPRPTAVVPISGVGALAALRYLMQQRISIPDEVSLVCFDPVPISEYLPVPMTGLFYSAQEYGKVALDLLWNDLSESQHRLIEPELVIRASTGPARPD